MALKELLHSPTAEQAHGSVRSLAAILGFKPRISLRHLLTEGARELVLREKRIKHVFVLMLENRSFDHVFGLSQLTGADPLGQPRRAAGVPVPVPKNKDWAVSNVAPNAFSVGDKAKFNLDQDTDGDPPHEFNDVLIQLCGQQAFQSLPTDDDDQVLLDGGYPPIDNSGFVASYHRPGSKATNPDLVLQCFQASKLPVLHALAKEFAVCDNWFASMPGPTWPNRFFAHAASAGGLDDSPSGFDIAVSETIDGCDDSAS